MCPIFFFLSVCLSVCPCLLTLLCNYVSYLLLLRIVCLSVRVFLHYFGTMCPIFFFLSVCLSVRVFLHYFGTMCPIFFFFFLSVCLSVSSYITLQLCVLSSSSSSSYLSVCPSVSSNITLQLCVLSSSSYLSVCPSVLFLFTFACLFGTFKFIYWRLLPSLIISFCFDFFLRILRLFFIICLRFLFSPLHFFLF